MWHGKAEFLCQLISAGRGVSKCNIVDYSPICVAAENGKAECLSYLVTLGADIAKDIYFASPLRIRQIYLSRPFLFHSEVGSFVQ